MKLVAKGPKATDPSQSWQITLAGKTIITQSGLLDGKQREKKQSFKTPKLAKEAHDKLVADKRGGGYRGRYELPAPKVTSVRDEKLEAVIREDRTDRGAYSVYADWLQAQGSELGQVIALALANKPKPALALAKKFGLPPATLATFGWRFGLWQWLRLENSVDWMDASFEPLVLARSLFASPLCSALEELRLGILRWDENATDVPAVIAEAGRHAWAHDLAKLHLGDVSGDIDMAHHVVGDVGKAISKHFPNLTSLKIHSGSQSWRGSKETFGIGGLVLPKLTKLTIETCAMSRKRLKSLREAKLPALEHLEVWFGAREQDCDAKVADVLPLFDGTLFPRVRHLGLRNTELVADLVRLLPMSKLAGQLEVLDLSMGTLNDEEASELAEAAGSFKALTTLNVDDSFLTSAGLKTLKAAFKGKQVVSTEQREPDDYDDEDEDEGAGNRYVSVTE